MHSSQELQAHKELAQRVADSQQQVDKLNEALMESKEDANRREQEAKLEANLRVERAKAEIEEKLHAE